MIFGDCSLWVMKVQSSEMGFLHGPSCHLQVGWGFSGGGGGGTGSLI